LAEYTLTLRRLVGSEPLLQVPSAAVALRDASGRVLLAFQSDGRRWVLPGGAIEPGELPADAALREMWEETGLLVRLKRLVGVFGGPDSIVRYSNGDRTSYVMNVFEAEHDSGTPRPDGTEISDLRFVTAGEAARLPIAPWLPEVLEALAGDAGAAAFRPPTWTPPAET
jgi:8-oxo-dGTP pyrophosphatase MutT (NUDIX family)